VVISGGLGGKMGSGDTDGHIKGVVFEGGGGGEGGKVVRLNIKHIYQTFFWSNQVHAVLEDLLYLVWNERELFLEYQIEQVW
jgi:hypothetical protein